MATGLPKGSMEMMLDNMVSALMRITKQVHYLRCTRTDNEVFVTFRNVSDYRMAISFMRQQNPMRVILLEYNDVFVPVSGPREVLSKYDGAPVMCINLMLAGEVQDATTYEVPMSCLLELEP